MCCEIDRLRSCCEGERTLPRDGHHPRALGHPFYYWNLKQQAEKGVARHLTTLLLPTWRSENNFKTATINYDNYYHYCYQPGSLTTTTTKTIRKRVTRRHHQPVLAYIPPLNRHLLLISLELRKKLRCLSFFWLGRTTRWHAAKKQEGSLVFLFSSDQSSPFS